MIDVAEVRKRFQSGRWLVSLADVLDSGKNSEVEISEHEIME
jgi:hypothetical protein